MNEALESANEEQERLLKKARQQGQKLIDTQSKAAEEQADKIVDEAKRESDFIKKSGEKKLSHLSDLIVDGLVK